MSYIILIKKFNHYIKRKNLPSIRLLTDSEGYVVKLDTFTNLVSTYLSILDKEELKELYYILTKNQGYLNNTNISYVYEILQVFRKSIPHKIVNDDIVNHKSKCGYKRY